MDGQQYIKKNNKIFNDKITSFLSHSSQSQELKWTMDNKTYFFNDKIWTFTMSWTATTDSNYLGYYISKYKSDLEDKLQTYNKINGAIRRHFEQVKFLRHLLGITKLDK